MQAELNVLASEVAKGPTAEGLRRKTLTNKAKVEVLEHYDKLPKVWLLVQNGGNRMLRNLVFPSSCGELF